MMISMIRWNRLNNGCEVMATPPNEGEKNLSVDHLICISIEKEFLTIFLIDCGKHE